MGFAHFLFPASSFFGSFGKRNISIVTFPSWFSLCTILVLSLVFDILPLSIKVFHLIELLWRLRVRRIDEIVYLFSLCLFLMISYCSVGGFLVFVSLNFPIVNGLCWYSLLDIFSHLFSCSGVIFFSWYLQIEIFFYFLILSHSMVLTFVVKLGRYCSWRHIAVYWINLSRTLSSFSSSFGYRDIFLFILSVVISIKLIII